MTINYYINFISILFLETIILILFKFSLVWNMIEIVYIGTWYLKG